VRGAQWQSIINKYNGRENVPSTMSRNWIKEQMEYRMQLVMCPDVEKVPELAFAVWDLLPEAAQNAALISDQMWSEP